MAKQVKQFRYYNNNASNKNYPQGISHRNVVSGSVFQPYMPITQLGIQALPGTKFYLNNDKMPIIIGYTGIYELDLEGIAEITAIQFENTSVDAIDNNENAYLIVDIIYETDGDA